MSLAPVAALAWGNTGHEVVALVAQRYLTKQASARLDALLRADSDTLTPPDLASRATWADRYRDSDRNTTKQRYKATRQWHFVDIEIGHPDLPASCSGHPPISDPASLGPADACVADKISQFEAELTRLRGTDPERLLALKFLLHFVGDVHQPLHAANNNDSGGNAVKVLFGNRKVGQSLHGYWDTAVVRTIGRDPVQIAAKLGHRFDARCRKGWMQGGPDDWAMESFTLARTAAYRLPALPAEDARGQDAFLLDAAYQRRARAVASEQLAKAGCRLAMILNRALH